MKVSLSTLKQFIDFELPPIDEFVARINAQLGGVEEVIDLNAKYKDARIVKVVKCEKHPNADKLSVCMVDAGTGELVQIVCGANNVHAGMWAVWLPPKSTVPATYGDEEPFVLGSRELRGVISNGMLASARELGIGDDHDGIVDIAEDDVPSGKKLAVGAGFAKIFGLNDYVIDIENKMFTHRPDLFGQLGVAREIAGIFGKKFKSPEWYGSLEGERWNIEDGDGMPLEVFNDAPDMAPRLMAVAVKDVEVKPSPLWLQCALVAQGAKPINNIVDATNYIMLLTAQPVHAYDYDKLHGHKLGVRMAQDGESLPLLNGKTYKLTSDDIVIADGEGAIGLAGIMGGGNSEVSSNTKNIVLEVANFDMYTVRKSSMRYGLFTDALTRFNKGQSPLQTPAVMAKLMAFVGGDKASLVYDLGRVNNEQGAVEVAVTPEFINERLGLKLDSTDIESLLGNVEINAQIPVVTPPFWRTDIELPEDIVEEVGRLYGYNKLPHELPYRSIKPAPLNPDRDLAWSVRDILARAGASEVLTYSFLHERVLKSAGQDVNDAYQLSNALSPDLQYYRLSLMPNLLDKVHANIKAGYDEFSLFEIGKSHSKKSGFDNQGLPVEPQSIAMVYASKHEKDGAAFYRAKTVLEFLANNLGIELTYELLGSGSTSPIAAPFELKRSAVVTDKNTGKYVGVVGEYNRSASRSFKLPEYSAGFELNVEAILKLVGQVKSRYQPLSRYPSTERDISLKVARDMSYGDVYRAVNNAFIDMHLDISVSPVGIYQPEGSVTKNITFRISLSSHARTLTSTEANSAIDEVMKGLYALIGAELV